MEKYILVDSGFWFGLLDRTDQYNAQSEEVSKTIEEYTLIIPFPSLYEVLNTSFIKRKDRIEYLENLIKARKAILFSDENYKEEALKTVYNTHKNPSSPISLVDSIIREILKDINIRIDGLVTFNPNDFSDVCQIRSVPILP